MFPHTFSFYNESLIDIKTGSEEHLMACTAAGAVVGGVVGLLLHQTQALILGGSVWAVYFSNKTNKFGDWTRAGGELVLYGVAIARLLVADLQTKWKAWHVYENSFKWVAELDEKYGISEKVSRWNSRTGFSDQAEEVFKRISAGVVATEKTLEEYFTVYGPKWGASSKQFGINLYDNFHKQTENLETFAANSTEAISKGAIWAMASAQDGWRDLSTRWSAYQTKIYEEMGYGNSTTSASATSTSTSTGSNASPNMAGITTGAVAKTGMSAGEKNAAVATMAVDLLGARNSSKLFA